MKRIKYLVLSSLVATNLFAISLDEVLNISLEKNLDIAISNYEYKETKEDYNKSKSAFLPKVDLSYSYNNSDKQTPGQIKEDSTASATISYNLFNGFKDFSELYSTKYLRNASKFSYNAKKQDILLSTKEAYIDYLNKRKNLLTQEDSYKLFENQYIDAKNQFIQGLVSKNDLLKVEVNMLNAKQSVIQAKGDLNISLYSLSNILGGYDLTNEKIEELNINENKNFVYDVSLLENRSEIKAYELNLKSIKEQSFGSRNTFMPKVDASVSYNKYGDDENIGGRDLYPDSQEVVNVTASWNLYNGNSDYSDIIKKNIQVKKAVANLEKIRLSIKLQYQNALSSLAVSKANFETSKLALKQAEENYTIVKNRFQEGLSDNTDLIDANYLLSAAKQNYYKAYYDKYISVETLNRILEK
ncbi:TolC family protein [Arcobacter sp. KX21116]|uniref:TolC family protein n=1 Tax=Arcobacter iocasae TaxID=2906515 RepID=UPI0035D3EBA7